MWSSWYLWGAPAILILIDSSASNNTSVFRLVFSNLCCRFSLLLRHAMKYYKRSAAGIGISNFLRAFFMISLHSSSSGSMKQIPRNFRALSSFGFVSPTFASLYVLMHQTYVSKFLTTKCLVWRSFVFLPISHRTTYIHPVVFRSIWKILWHLSTYLTLLDLHRRSNNRQHFSSTSHLMSCLQFWRRKCISVG